MGNQKSKSKSNVKSRNLKSLVVKTLDSSMLNKSWDPNDLYNNYLEKALENKENIQRLLTKNEYYNDSLQLKRRKPLKKIFDFRSNLKSFEVPLNLMTSVITSYINNNLNESDYKSIIDLTVFNILPLDLKDMYFNHTNQGDKQKLLKQMLKSLETKTELLNKLENSEILNYLDKSQYNTSSEIYKNNLVDSNLLDKSKIENEKIIDKNEINHKEDKVKNDNIKESRNKSQIIENQNSTPIRTMTQNKSRNFLESRMLNMINKTNNKSINNITISHENNHSKNPNDFAKSNNFNSLSQRTVNNPYIKGKLSLNSKENSNVIQYNMNNNRSRLGRHESDVKHFNYNYSSKSIGKLKESIKSSSTNANVLNVSGISQIKSKKDHSPINSRNEGSFIKALEYGYNLFKTSKSPLNFKNNYSHSSYKINANNKGKNEYANYNNSNTIIYETKIPDFSKIEAYQKELSSNTDLKSNFKINANNNTATNNILHSQNYNQTGYVEILKNKMNLLKSKLIEKKEEKMNSNKSSSRKEVNNMAETTIEKPHIYKNDKEIIFEQDRFKLKSSNLNNINSNINKILEEKTKYDKNKNKTHIININSHVTNINPIMYSSDHNKQNSKKEIEKSSTNSNKSKSKPKEETNRMTANFKQDERTIHKHTKTNSFGLDTKTIDKKINFDEKDKNFLDNKNNNDRFSFNRVTLKENNNQDKFSEYENQLNDDSTKYIKKKIPFSKNNNNNSIRSDGKNTEEDSLSDVKLYNTSKENAKEQGIKPFNKKLDLSNLINKKIVKK